PTLQPYVDPPSIRLRHIAAGVATGAFAMLITLGIVRYSAHQHAAARADARYAAREGCGQAEASKMAAQLIATEYATVGWPAWVVAHPDEPCPMRLAELEPYVSATTHVDPWGTPFRFTCDGLHMTVSSLGPDRELGTDD